MFAGLLGEKDEGKTKEGFLIIPICLVSASCLVNIR